MTFPPSLARPLFRRLAVEAELALSQKNTIPNASAVVFRRPEDLDFADELVKLKFAGDWFFYSMLIRGGKVNFMPEVLNFYRRHEATVSHRSVREDTPGAGIALREGESIRDLSGDSEANHGQSGAIRARIQSAN